MDPAFQQRVKAELIATRAKLSNRVSRIEADRRRQVNELEADFAEQAVQRENDEVLDALGEQGIEQVEAIDATLARMTAGTYGVCTSCERPIARARLEAVPTAAMCVACTEAED